ncbi:YIP1 family protein [Solibacillus sp. CAU 1738]|uniref:YIP1 family protein n=1 Tax=Solibacillus sp. CAU 1738 TaxID=3140363 RepID=UPI0032616D34
MTTKTVVVDDREPVLSIAVKMRETIRYTLNKKSVGYILFIGAAGGFSSALTAYIGTIYPYKYTLADIVHSAFLTGTLAFLITLLVLTFSINIVSMLFKGKGTFKELFLSLCLTMIPYIWVLPLTLFWMQLSPETFFEISGVEQTLSGVIWQFVALFIYLMITIWSFCITITVISEVHKFSKWKSFFSLFIASCALGIVLALFGFV